MFQFSEWIAGSMKRIYIASGCHEKVFIEQLVKTGEARIRCKLPGECAYQTKLLTEAGFDFTQRFESWDQLVSALFKLPGTHTRHFQQPVRQSTTPIIDARPLDVLANQTMEFALDSAPFKKNTLMNCKITVDSREPDKLMQKLSEGKLWVERQSLPFGDIMISSSDTLDHILIERKTVTDLYTAITGEDHRFHRQAEALYQYQSDKESEGVRVKVIWIVEAERNGVRGLYNCLPKTNQMDGVVNYLVAILGQHLVTAFNLHHMGYLIMKFAQGFFEQELPNPIRTATGGQVDKRKSERSEGHGVSVAGRDNLFHVLTAFKNIDSRIAKSLMDSGLVLRDILGLSEEELQRFDGIGKTKAKKIAEEFKM